MKNKSRTIVLGGGSEESWEWRLKIDFSAKQRVWAGYYYTETSLTKYRRWVRTNDRAWAERTFFRQWRQKYEIHHEWERGEVCYFLTSEEHKRRI